MWYVFLPLLLTIALLFGINDSFANQGTNVDSITFVQHLDENTALEEIQKGTFDIYNYPVPYNEIITDDGNPPTDIQIFNSAEGIKYTLFVNPADSTSQFNPFSHKEIRYSLNYLVDRTAIVDEFFHGQGQAILSNFGPTHPDYLLVYRQLDALDIHYNPQLADEMISKILAAEGAVKIKGKWHVDNNPIQIKMFIRDDDPIRLLIGNSLAAELEKLGFTIEKTTGNLRGAFAQVYGSNPVNFTWHIYTESFGGLPVIKYDNAGLPSYYAPWSSNMPGAGNPSYWNYENKFLDSITMRIYNEDFDNVEQRASLVRQASMEGVQEAVRIFLAVKDDNYIARDGISGIVNAQGMGITSRFTPINVSIEDGDSNEVEDSAGARANTGSVALDRTVYPVPFGTPSDFPQTETDGSYFAVHATAIDNNVDAPGRHLDNGQLMIHVRVNDPDYDVSGSGQDKIAESGTHGPVKVMVTRGGDTVLLGTAGSDRAGGNDQMITIGDNVQDNTREFGPIVEIAPDAGIFEIDIPLAYTDGPVSTTCPVSEDDAVSHIAASTDNGNANNQHCILQGDILTVEYTDPTDASGSINTVTDSATFDLRNGVLQSDKSVYIIGSDMILTLIEPDFDLDNDGAETYSLDLIEWDSDAATTTMGSLGTDSAAFDPEPSNLRETGDSTGIFQIVIEIPESIRDPIRY